MIQTCTHSEHSADGVLLAQHQRAAVPEGQSVRQVDYQEGEAHGEVGGDRLLYSHPFSILQVLIVSVGNHVSGKAKSGLKGYWITRTTKPSRPDKCHISRRH